MCLKTLEDDCEKTACEGDERAQGLRNEKCALHAKAHYLQKEIKSNHLEVEHLKKNLEFLREEQLTLNKKVKESDAKVEDAESCIEEVQ